RLGYHSTAVLIQCTSASPVTSNGQIIIIDEPTAALTQREIETLLETVRGLSSQGLSFIFISHKLREVTSIADDITVIRDGGLIASGPAREYDAERISSLMTGGAVTNERRETGEHDGEAPIIETRDLTLKSSFHNEELQPH